MQIDSEYANGFMRLGLLYIEQENYKEAAKNLKISTDLDDKDHNKYFNLASAYNQLEKWDEAAKAAQSCIDLKKKFGGGWLELGLAEMGKEIERVQKSILSKRVMIETSENWQKER